MSQSAFKVAIGGDAVVCCVHDRRKRVVTTETQLAALFTAAGQVYDTKQWKIQSCGCCGNLFADKSDVPRYCGICSGDLVHGLAAPLPEPTGVTDG